MGILILLKGGTMGQPGSRILRWNSGLVRFCKLTVYAGK